MTVDTPYTSIQISTQPQITSLISAYYILASGLL